MAEGKGKLHAVFHGKKPGGFLFVIPDRDADERKDQDKLARRVTR